MHVVQRIVAVAVVSFCAASPALANGRFPNAQQLRELDPQTLVVAGTYGMLVTTNGGRDFAYQCEAEIFGKPTGTYTVDPLLEVASDGAIFSGSLHALRISRDLSCAFEAEPSLPNNWSFFELERPEGAESGQIVDVCRRGGGADAPVLALARMLDDAATTTEFRLYQANARGVFEVVGAPIPVALMDFGLTLDVAPSDPERIYVSGTLDNDPVLLASDDGGRSFRSSPIVVGDPDFVLGAYLAAVSPNDPERLYLRVARRVQTKGGLYQRDDSLAVSSDGGRSVSEVLRAQANLLGFALSLDGTVVLAGYGDPRVDETLSSPAVVGIYRGDADALAFEHVVTDIDVSCLRFTESGLYACALERDPLGVDPAFLDDFHLGIYRGAGTPTSAADFTPLLKLKDVRGPAPWNDGRTTACAEEWTSGDPNAPVPVGTCTRLNACESGAARSDALVCGMATGVGGSGAMDAGKGGPGAPDAGCGCRLVRTDTKNPLVLLVFVAVALGRTRRRGVPAGALSAPRRKLRVD